VSKLDSDEKGVVITDTPGGKQKKNIIHESGVYSLIFKSSKEKARKFTKWITSEVIPSLRRNGNYGILPRDPKEQALILAKQLIEMDKKVKELEGEVEEHKQNTKIVDTIVTNGKNITTTELAKCFGVKPEFFRNWMVENGFLYWRDRRRIPAQKYLDNNIFEHKIHIYQDSNGNDHATPNPRVTPKGVAFLTKKWNENRQLELYN